jgi:hypothetical protein
MAVITKVSPMTTGKPDSSGDLPDGVLEIQRIKHDVAIHLIEEWLADESGYDETVWETVKTTIEDNKLSERRRFDE